MITREAMRQRPRRLRRTEAIRRMVEETGLSRNRFILPIFVAEHLTEPEPVSSLPGHFHWPPEQVAREAESVASLGIPAVLVFGIPAAKDEAGSEAYNPGGVVHRAVAAIKKEVPDLLVITDVCLCQYTSHGHCGIVGEQGEVLNDPTVELLSRTALSHAQAGADMVAPSDMMDGRVGAIRRGLDEASFEHLPIMAYSAKYASAFYGPFREAVVSAPQFGDRRGYQMDPANRRAALREIELDVSEGADIVMVKPALAYLDVICEVRRATSLPLAAYNVSGEYLMVKAAADKGLLDERLAVMEILTAIRRAGADIIITYHAKDAVCWLAG